MCSSIVRTPVFFKTLSLLGQIQFPSSSCRTKSLATPWQHRRRKLRSWRIRSFISTQNLLPQSGKCNHCPAKHRHRFWSCVILNEEPPHARPFFPRTPWISLHRFLIIVTLCCDPTQALEHFNNVDGLASIFENKILFHLLVSLRHCLLLPPLGGAASLHIFVAW
jgi:hypothetical protein